MYFSKDPLVHLGEAVILWGNGRNTVILLRNYKLRGNFDLCLIQPTTKMSRAITVPTEKLLEEDSSLSVIDLPEFPNLQSYQAEIDAWTEDTDNWWRSDQRLGEDCRFVLLTEHLDDEGEVEASLPLQVRLADSPDMIGVYIPHVNNLNSLWEQSGKSKAQKLGVPGDILSLCDRILSAVSTLSNRVETP